MLRIKWMVVSATVAALAVTGAFADEPARSSPERVTDAATTVAGTIQGTVIDDRGAPLRGAMVSALGVTMAFAVTDADGRFTLRRLPPGPYLLRAHLPGFAASQRTIIDVRPSLRSLSSLRLHRTSGPQPVATSGAVPARPILAAGVVGPPSADQADPSAEDSSGEKDNHSESAWRLRHVKRSVLKEITDFSVVAASAGDTDWAGDAPPTLLSHRFAASRMTGLVNDFPISGELNLLTTSSFDRPQDLFSADGLPRNVAFLSLGLSSSDHAEWVVQGAMTQGDVSSWILAGAYTHRAPSAHSYSVGMSYSTQRYDGGNPAALAAVTDGSRNVGAVYGDDTWAISRRVTVDYGARFARYDYLEGHGLFGGRIGVSLTPAAHTRLVGAVSQRRVAPGAEEFLPPAVSGVWLPPERTFAPVTPASSFRAERTRHVEFGIERDLGKDAVIGVRRFYQQVDDQLATLFGVGDTETARAALGHYFVGNPGSADTDGWTFALQHNLSRRFRGSVNYTRTSARWTISPEAAVLTMWAPTLARAEREKFHDVTTAVETEIPETATRLFVVYKINSAFTRDEAVTRPGLDSRFDVQVKQGLPFMQFTNTEWEVLVAVRNLFREPQVDSSVYDELLVVRPPKRIVGGLLVRF
ncbi:MAG: TonB-dependent receptor [Acidobacteria bacterium]|nr:TonB-dependent receptor [Acidobacteriota bacterium]